MAGDNFGAVSRYLDPRKKYVVLKEGIILVFDSSFKIVQKFYSLFLLPQIDYLFVFTALTHFGFSKIKGFLNGRAGSKKLIYHGLSHLKAIVVVSHGPRANEHDYEECRNHDKVEQAP